MYTIIRRNYPNIGVSWHGIRKIYEKCEWLNAPPKRKAQPQQRCRYQAVYPNQIWHVDIHIWSKYTGLYIFGVIDDRSRFLIESREKPRQDGKNPSRVPSEKVK